MAFCVSFLPCLPLKEMKRLQTPPSAVANTCTSAEKARGEKILKNQKEMKDAKDKANKTLFFTKEEEEKKGKKNTVQCA